MKLNKQNNKPIYALDFDGVICDSAIETAITGWKVARKIWKDMPASPPSGALIDRFRRVRPLLETGYEAIIIMRLLYLKVTVESLLQDYSIQIQFCLEAKKLDITELKQLFGDMRDDWISQSPQQWLEMNPLFKGVKQQLATLTDSTWYIITTKQKRFVKQILQASEITIDDTCIYAMEAKMSKQETLIKLSNKHSDKNIIFIEDRFPTLLNISNNTQLKKIKLQLADWGYNTKSDKQRAQQQGIEVISLNQLLAHSNKKDY